MAGMDPEDFQQEYLVNRAKVSFFVPEEPLGTVLRPGRSGWSASCYFRRERDRVEIERARRARPT